MGCWDAREELDGKECGGKGLIGGYNKEDEFQMNLEAVDNGNKWKTIGEEENRPFVCEKLISK